MKTSLHETKQQDDKQWHANRLSSGKKLLEILGCNRIELFRDGETRVERTADDLLP